LPGGREQQLLVALCARALDPAGDIPAFEAHDIDWPHLLALAKRHRVGPLVWSAISKAPTAILPASVAASFRAVHEQNALNSLRLTARLIRIVSSLADAGIAAVPLKGICLAARYYPVATARHAGDIDLLIAPDRLGDAAATLERLGYHPTSKQAFGLKRSSDDDDYRLHNLYIAADHVLVEVHFRLHNNPGILPLGIAGIIAAGATVSFGGTTLPVMSDALQFVFLATHGARHEWERIQWVADIALMVRGASVETVRQWLAIAAGHGLLNPAVQALVIANHLFGIALPPEASDAFRRSWRIRFLVRRAEDCLMRGGDRKPAAPQSLKIGRRIYRLCVASQPGYIAAEIQNSVRAMVTRLAKPAATAR
jgi:hypothetical protein